MRIVDDSLNFVDLKGSMKAKILTPLVFAALLAGCSNYEPSTFSCTFSFLPPDASLCLMGSDDLQNIKDCESAGGVVGSTCDEQDAKMVCEDPEGTLYLYGQTILTGNFTCEMFVH